MVPVAEPSSATRIAFGEVNDLVAAAIEHVQMQEAYGHQGLPSRPLQSRFCCRRRADCMTSPTAAAENNSTGDVRVITPPSPGHGRHPILINGFGLDFAA
jgi:hypothetical protein